MRDYVEIFEDEIAQWDKQICDAKKLNAVNSKLQNLNWIFLHPYNQGGDIEILDHILQDLQADEKVNDFFARKFLDLRTTITFIDGFYRKRPFLKDYVGSIEESVVLCLQKDFRGGIITLLPVIEGTLRKYLVYKKGDSKKSAIGIKLLLEAVNSLIEDHCNIQKKYFTERVGMVSNLNKKQEKLLEEKRREYFDIWIKQFSRYLENNLYKKTTEELQDNFNRNIIIHALDYNTEYSFSNYLRLFNCVNFLSWAIGAVTDECSVFADISNTELNNKWSDYLKILVVSESLTESKSRIYDRNIGSFKKYLSKDTLAFINRAENQVNNALSSYDFLKSDSKPILPSITKIIKLLLFYISIRRRHK